MTTLNLGRVGLVPRGAYDEDTAYVKYDVVAYNGAAYVVIADSVTGVTPSDDGENYVVLVDNARVEQLVEAIEEATAEIPADYTELQNDVGDLKSAFDSSKYTVIEQFATGRYAASATVGQSYNPTKTEDNGWVCLKVPVYAYDTISLYGNGTDGTLLWVLVDVDNVVVACVDGGKTVTSLNPIILNVAHDGYLYMNSSVSNAHKCEHLFVNGAEYIKNHYISDLFHDEKADMFEWLLGGIQTASGEPGSTDTRIRLKGYLDTSVTNISVASGYKYAIYAWQDNGTYLGVWTGTSYVTTLLTWWTGDTNTELLGNYKHKVVIAKSNDSTISTSDADKLTFTITADPTLTLPGVAADAKAVGDRIASVKSTADEAYSDAKELLEYIGINHGSDLTFESGGISPSDGTETSSTKRLRSKIFYAEKGTTFAHLNNSWLGVYKYRDAAGTQFISGRGLTQADYTLGTSCYVRIALAGYGEPDLSTSDWVNLVYPTILTYNLHDIVRRYNDQSAIMLPVDIPNGKEIVASVPYDNSSVYSLSEIIAGYDALVSAYPGYVTKTDMGVDSSGDYHVYKYVFSPASVDLMLTSVSGNYFNASTHPVVYMDAGLHGEEKPITRALLNFMTKVCESADEDGSFGWLRRNVKFIIIPVVCPYGYVNSLRYNANHVNINRNFDTAVWSNGTDDPTSSDYRGASPASEKETQYVQSIVDELSSQLTTAFYFNWHTHGVFTAYKQMTSFSVPSYKQDELQKIGIEVIKELTASGWKNHDLPTNSGFIGIIEFHTENSSAAVYGSEHKIPSATPEGMYKYYDGSYSVDYSTKVNSMNVEFILKSVMITLKRLMYM